MVEATFNNFWNSTFNFTSRTINFISVDFTKPTSTFQFHTDISILSSPLQPNYDRKSEAERPTNLSSPGISFSKNIFVDRHANHERYD